MSVRQPIVAGRFYPGDAGACRDAIQQCRAAAVTPTEKLTALVGGIVPHAGWMCSGGVAVGVFDALARECDPQVVVLFGAVHRWSGEGGAICASGAWETPLGEVRVAEEIAKTLITRCPHLIESSDAHREEHSLEVQIPFIQQSFPNAAILPMVVTPGSPAIEIGAVVGTLLIERGIGAIVVGSTDLTHYGPSYRFTPQGIGEAGIRWARDVNDRRVIERMLSLDADGVLQEAREHHNACGGGAIAATLSAAQTLGANRAQELQHTTSHDVLGGRSDDSVGYVGIVLGS